MTVSSGKCHSRSVTHLGNLIGMGHSRGICVQRDFVRAGIPPSTNRQEPWFPGPSTSLLLICKSFVLSVLQLPHP